MIIAATPAIAAAQDLTVIEEPQTEAEDYVERGTWEVGGSIGGSFAGDVVTITASPTIGYFVVDRVELSLTANLTYIRTEDELTEMTTEQKTGALIFEPSYHHPLTENLLALGGVGLGVGYDGDDPDFEIIPRLGLNILTSRSSVITPSIRLPILIGEGHGMDGDVGTDVGFTFDIGITTTW